MARRANDTWRANDGTLFEGEDAKARAKKHDAWCELVELCNTFDCSELGALAVAAFVVQHDAELVRILKANPEKGGAA